MQGQHGIVLRLREPVARVQRDFACGSPFGLRDGGVAVLVKDEHIQQRGLGDVRLLGDSRKPGLGIGIGDAYGGPVIEILAGCGMLSNRFQCGDGVIVDRFVGELADRPAIEQGFNSAIGNHAAIVAGNHADANVSAHSKRIPRRG